MKPAINLLLTTLTFSEESPPAGPKAITVLTIGAFLFFIVMIRSFGPACNVGHVGMDMRVCMYVYARKHFQAIMYICMHACIQTHAHNQTDIHPMHKYLPTHTQEKAAKQKRSSSARVHERILSDAARGHTHVDLASAHLE